MKVSVVMPTYNRAYIIREALESALGQTYRDFELIVVDDGSSDNTREIVASLPQEKIRYIRHERNRGCSAAYNTGIAAATGELVAFLDSDDLWQPDYLTRQVEFLLRHPEVDAVFTDTEIRGETVIPSLIGLMKAFPKLLKANRVVDEFILRGRQMYLCLLEEVPIKPTALIVKREMFDRAGAFDEAWPSGTDWDLFLRFSRSARFGYLNRPLVIQRRTSDSTYQKFFEQDKLFLLKVFTEEKARLQNDREALAAINRGISIHTRSLGGHWVYLGRRKDASAIYFQGFKETRKPVLLLRAASVWLPLGLRRVLRRLLGRAPSSGSRLADNKTTHGAEAGREK